MQRKPFAPENTKKGHKRQQPEDVPRIGKNYKKFCWKREDNNGILNLAALSIQAQHTLQPIVPGQKASHIMEQYITQRDRSAMPKSREEM